MTQVYTNPTQISPETVWEKAGCVLRTSTICMYNVMTGRNLNRAGFVLQDAFSTRRRLLLYLLVPHPLLAESEADVTVRALITYLYVLLNKGHSCLGPVTTHESLCSVTGKVLFSVIYSTFLKARGMVLAVRLLHLLSFADLSGHHVHLALVRRWHIGRKDSLSHALISACFFAPVTTVVSNDTADYGTDRSRVCGFRSWNRSGSTGGACTTARCSDGIRVRSKSESHQDH